MKDQVSDKGSGEPLVLEYK